LRQILALGANSRLPAALSTEACVEAAAGGRFLWRRAERMLKKAEHWAEKGTPFDRVTVLCCWGQYYYFQGQWQESLVWSQKALDLALAETSGQKHGIAIINAYLLSAVALQGDLRNLARLRDEVLSDARRRGDVLVENLMESAEFVLVRLARDQPDAAIRAAEGVLGSFHAKHFTSQHYYHLIAMVKAHVYAGRGGDAWRQVDAERWTILEASGFHKLTWIGTHMRYLRACAAIAAAHDSKAGRAAKAEPAMLLEVAEREAHWIGRTHLPVAKTMASAIRAGIAFETGGDAAPLLIAAREGFAASSMKLHEHSASIVLAQLRGESADESEAWMREHEVLFPAKMARTHVPVHVA
jgi:hypothetical protein